MLLGLDRSIRTADRDWGDYLVAAVRDFVIWGMEPVGAVNGEKAAWLLAAVSDGGPTGNVRAIFREVAREARLIDDNAAIALAGGTKCQARNPDGEARVRIVSEPSIQLARASEMRLNDPI